MGTSSATEIRKFDRKDRDAVRRICCDTALMGEPGQAFFDGDDILADALTMYFTDFEPGSCFVAETAGTVTGYLIGAKDSRVLGRIFREKILLRLLYKALRAGALLKKKNMIFIMHVLASAFRGEFNDPDFFKAYPATLHINLAQGWRGRGIGVRLITAYVQYLVAAGVRGVRLCTMSDGAALFFEKQGFRLLYRSRRSYFRYLLRKDIPVYIYGKVL